MDQNYNSQNDQLGDTGVPNIEHDPNVIQNTDQTINPIWDPLQPALDLASIIESRGESDKLIQKFTYNKQHPYAIRKKMLMYSLLTLAIWVFLAAIKIPFFEDSGKLYALAIVPPLLYFTSIKKLEKQLAELLIAEDFNWLYDPEEDKNRGSELAIVYPEIFQKGNEGSQNVSNQFWGKVNNKSNFWMGSFHFVVGRGKNSRDVTQSVYAFELPHRAATDFLLVPQSFFKKMESSLTTESNDFNKLFHIEYKGDTNDVGAEIFQVLSSTAQERLIEFRKSCGDFSLLFRESTMVVSFSKTFKLRHTNFFNNVSIDLRDIDNLTNQLLSTLELADAVLPCID